MAFFRHLHLGKSIARRYFVVNGFDGALTILGIIVGFYVSQSAEIHVIINACIGAAVALGISGLSSAYISEQAERQKELNELEQAMIRDLSDSQHERLARNIPIFVALVNGLSPFLISLLILLPLFYADYLYGLAIDPLQTSIIIAFAILFLLGIFIGKISQTFWLWSGIRTLLIALTTIALIYIIT